MFAFSQNYPHVLAERAEVQLLEWGVLLRARQSSEWAAEGPGKEVFRDARTKMSFG